MRKIGFLATLLLIYSTILFSQVRVGDWRTHLSYNDATQTVIAKNKIYVLSDQSLYSYDKEDQSIETYTKINALSDAKISTIAYDANSQLLVIAYQNGNIDLLSEDQTCFNIPDLKNKITALSKETNSIYFEKEFAYFSLNFGVMVINLHKKEVANSFILNRVVYGSIIQENTLYISTNQGVYKGSLSANLLDPANWILVQSRVGKDLVLLENKIVTNYPADGIFEVASQQKVASGSYTQLLQKNTNIIARNENSITIFNSSTDYQQILNYPNQSIAFNESDQTYWIGIPKEGLRGSKLNKESASFETIVSNIKPISPKTNNFYTLSFVGNRLLTTSGSVDVGGTLTSIPGATNYFENERWTYFEEDAISSTIQAPYLDLTSIAQDPLDPTHHFVTSWLLGLLEFREGKFVTLFDQKASEGNLVNVDSYQLRVTGANYDSDRNLWMLNSNVQNNVVVLTKERNWMHFTHPLLTKLNATIHLQFDQKGRAWILCERSTPRVIMLDYNHTLTDESDDQIASIDRFVNQDGEQIKGDRYYSMAEDKEGVIWIGTNSGPILITNPNLLLEGSKNCTQIKIPRNDGTNLADLLLIDEGIRAIAVDGANRKWIGTTGSGVYLLSANGQETIHHFDTSNSPLLSNNVSSIAIHPQTGEVFFGTSEGLISYRSDATEPTETLTKNSVYAFPNPVHPNYDGLITITGLISDTHVKIVDVTGRLIITGTSMGGQFVWNGNTQQGTRVASGVYYVLAADSEGKDGVATKILILK